MAAVPAILCCKRNKVGALSSSLERLSANPFQTVKKAALEMGVAFTTVQRAIEKLESLSIVTEVSGGKRDRVYCARALMDILEEPARLAP